MSVFTTHCNQYHCNSVPTEARYGALPPIANDVDEICVIDTPLVHCFVQNNGNFLGNNNGKDCLLNTGTFLN